MATDIAATCRVCGAPLGWKGNGRPPRYCSTTCRKQAEYALKRCNRRLLWLEGERDRTELLLRTTKLYAEMRRRLTLEVDVLNEQIAGYRAELGRLLDDRETVSPDGCIVDLERVKRC